MPVGNDPYHADRNPVVQNLVSGPETTNPTLEAVDHNTDLRVFGYAATRFEQAVDIGNRLRRTPSVSGVERDRLDVGRGLSRKSEPGHLFCEARFQFAEEQLPVDRSPGFEIGESLRDLEALDLGDL